MQAPRRWFATRFQGAPAPAYFPILFLSSQRLPPGCTPGPRTTESCQAQNWFAPRWRTPQDGVLILWAKAEYPGKGPSLSVYPGRSITIDHHHARLYSGPSTGSCPPGSSTEIQAWIQEFGPLHPGERFDSNACLGPHTPAQDRADVLTMSHQPSQANHNILTITRPTDHAAISSEHRDTDRPEPHDGSCRIWDAQRQLVPSGVVFRAAGLDAGRRLLVRMPVYACVESGCLLSGRASVRSAGSVCRSGLSVRRFRRAPGPR